MPTYLIEGTKTLYYTLIVDTGTESEARVIAHREINNGRTPDFTFTIREKITREAMKVKSCREVTLATIRARGSRNN